jgi:hypothetical protein
VLCCAAQPKHEEQQKKRRRRTASFFFLLCFSVPFRSFFVFSSLSLAVCLFSLPFPFRSGLCSAALCTHPHPSPPSVALRCSVAYLSYMMYSYSLPLPSPLLSAPHLSALYDVVCSSAPPIFASHTLFHLPPPPLSPSPSAPASRLLLFALLCVLCCLCPLPPFPSFPLFARETSPKKKQPTL